MTSFRTEFPDFDPATMPTIPSTWRDGSWRNDSMPTFYLVTSGDYDSGYYRGLMVAVDYLDPEQREETTFPRFTVCEHDNGTGADIYSGDDWAEVERHALAWVFAEFLRRDLSSEDFGKMRIRNATPDYGGGICASHDFTDANMQMDEAFTLVMGTSPLPENRDDQDEEMSDAAIVMWRSAWSIAKAAYLTETTQALTAEHEAYCKAQGLECACAGDMLMSATLTAEQREHLEAFADRWNTVQRAEDARAWGKAMNESHRLLRAEIRKP